MITAGVVWVLESDAESAGLSDGTGLGSRDNESGVTNPLTPLWLGDAGADLKIQ